MSEVVRDLVDPPVQLDLDLPEAVAAGQVLPVRLRATAERDVVVESLRVQLVRTVVRTVQEPSPGGFVYTATPQTRRVVVRRFSEVTGPVHAREFVGARVDLPVPVAEPGTVAGQLVTVDYEVEVVLVRRHARDIRRSKVLRVLGGRPPVPPGAEPAGPVSRNDGRRATLSCELFTGRRLAPGCDVSGVLSVTAVAAGDLAVAVELVLVEELIGGLGERAETIVARQTLMTAAPWQAGVSRALLFSLRIPASVPAPTLSTAEFATSWELRGVAAGHRGDADLVTVPVHLATRS